MHRSGGGAGRGVPRGRCRGPEDGQGLSGVQVTPDVEGGVDRAVGGNEALSLGLGA